MPDVRVARPLQIDFELMRRTEERIGGACKSPNTYRAYASGWNAFVLWCASIGRSSLPADPQTVKDFVTWCITQEVRLNTVILRICAIQHYHRSANHPSPVDRSIRQYINNARRDLKEEPGGKAALTYELLRKIVAQLPETACGVRNRAMVLLAFASGWRRSEIVALRYSDIQFVHRGVTLWQRSSKTDQIGAGRLVGIEQGRHSLTCPVEALRAWLEIRGCWDGPLFVRTKTGGQVPTRTALHSRNEVLYVLLKRSVARVGEDPRRFGAHSLRSGMITAAIDAGATETAIMHRTGHRTYEMIRKYARPARAFHANPLASVL